MAPTIGEAQPMSAGWRTVQDWRPSNIGTISTKWVCNATTQELDVYFRNTGSGTVKVEFDSNGLTGSVIVEPGILLKPPGGNRDGAWINNGSCVPPGVPLTLGFTRPDLNGIVFSKDQVDFLRQLDQQEKDLHFAQTLLSWSPLLELMGESSAAHVAVSIQSTDWDQLAQSVGALQVGGFRHLSEECYQQSITTTGKVSTFWKELGDFYFQRTGLSR